MRDSSNAPSMSRRSMMRGLAFALAGASVPVAAIAGVTARKLVAAPQADPEIAEIQAKLDTAFNAYRRAVNVRKDICREWMPRWPEPPKEILCAGAGFGYDMERDLTGYAIKDENDKRIYVHRAKDLRSFLSRAKGKARQKTLRQQIAIANAFEQQKEQIRTLSRYEAANADYWSTARKYDRSSRPLWIVPAKTCRTTSLRLMPWSSSVAWTIFCSSTSRTVTCGAPE